MNRLEFMKQLENLLRDLPESDRLDAIAYYNDYFDEAGVENEQKVIRELGSPEKVASTIKADFNLSGKGYGYSYGGNEVNSNTPATRKQKKKFPFILVIVLLLLAVPAILGVGGGLLYGALRFDENSLEETDKLSDNVFFFQQDSLDSLDIECAACMITIAYGDVDEIQVEQEGVEKFRCKLDGNTLKIQTETKNISTNEKRSVSIIIPNGFVFKEVDMEIGAGQATINDLCVGEFDIEVGAGQATLTNIDVQSLNASAGAGQIQAELVGAESDYNYDAEFGIGEIQIGGKTLSGLGGDTHMENPGAQRELDVKCGVGQITIEFQE